MPNLWIYNFSKIITGSGTFCKPVKGYREDPGGIRSANADEVTIKEVKNFFAENPRVSAQG